jgi:hypothetical protein
MAIKEDIIGLLTDIEVKWLLDAEACGVSAEVAYRKIKEFEATYPDDPSGPINGWLATLKEDVGRTRIIEEKKAKVREREIRLAERKHLDEEKFLDRRIAELDKQLGEEK